MRSLCPLLLLAAAVGCNPGQPELAKESEPADPKAALVGLWTATIELGAQDKAGLTADEIKEAEAQAADFQFDLEIKADGTYTVSSFEESGGTWELNGDNLTLKDGGEPPSEQEFTLEEGRLVARDPSGESDSLLVLTKA